MKLSGLIIEALLEGIVRGGLVMHLIGDGSPGFVKMFPYFRYRYRLPVSSCRLVGFVAVRCMEFIDAVDQQPVPWKAIWLLMLQSVNSE